MDHSSATNQDYFFIFVGMNESSKLIHDLGLERHPEGGWFKRVYPAPDEVGAPVSTIYYLLENKDFSAFHLLEGMTEIWYHHSGSPVDIHIIMPDGTYRKERIGDGKSFQAVVPPECWFAAEIPSGEGFALVGCAVSPAFVYEKFTLADRSFLLQKFPQHSALIERLTR